MLQAQTAAAVPSSPGRRRMPRRRRPPHQNVPPTSYPLIHGQIRNPIEMPYITRHNGQSPDERNRGPGKLGGCLPGLELKLTFRLVAFLWGVDARKGNPQPSPADSVDRLCYTSVLARLLHPGRNVTCSVQKAPDIDLRLLLDIKEQIRILPNGPEAKTGEVQFVSIA